MNRVRRLLRGFVVVAAIAALAQDAALSIDDEPHYSRIFSNEFCKVYAIALDRLGETKPIAHERNWVWMSVAGRVTEASGGTLFQSVGEPVGHEAGYSVHYRYPVNPYALRNDHINPYEGVVVELMKADESRWSGDPSVKAAIEYLSPGDTEKSYVTALAKTNVEIENVQLLGEAAQEIRASSNAQLLVALTDLDFRRETKGAKPMRIQLSRGEVKWIAEATTATFVNVGHDPARFALLQMK